MTPAELHPEGNYKHTRAGVRVRPPKRPTHSAPKRPSGSFRHISVMFYPDPLKSTPFQTVWQRTRGNTFAYPRSRHGAPL